jgi:hypothetical protein
VSSARAAAPATAEVRRLRRDMSRGMGFLLVRKLELSWVLSA